MSAQPAIRRHFLLWGLCAVVTVALYACASQSVRGKVINIWEDHVTVRKENDRIVTVTVENSEDVRILDTIIVKDKRAKIKDRVLDND